MIAQSRHGPVRRALPYLVPVLACLLAFADVPSARAAAAGARTPASWGQEAPLHLTWRTVRTQGARTAPVLAGGSILWLARGVGRPLTLMAAPWRSSGSARVARPVRAVGLPVGRHDQAVLLGALGADLGLVAVVPTTGLAAGVVANVWAIGSGGHRRLANLDPAGTRSRLVAGQTVVATGPGWALLAVGARAGFPAPYLPLHDVLVRASTGGRVMGLHVCPVPQALAPTSVVPTAERLLLVAQADRLEAIVGCPGPVRAITLGLLPAGFTPLLASVRRTGGRLAVAWVAGTTGLRVGTWLAAGPPGRWHLLWSVPAYALALQALPPELIAATAAEGRESATRIYDATTGQSAGPLDGLRVVAVGESAALVRRSGRQWLLRAPRSSTRHSATPRRP